MRPANPFLRRQSRQWYAIRAQCNAGEMHASKGEAGYCNVLLLRQRGGDIENLVHHPSWPLEVNGVLVGKYTADWSYRERGAFVVADYKGDRVSRDVRLRLLLMKALHGIEVQVVRKGGKG